MVITVYSLYQQVRRFVYRPAVCKAIYSSLRQLSRANIYLSGLIFKQQSFYFGNNLKQPAHMLCNSNFNTLRSLML